jgi:hypothetical protein
LYAAVAALELALKRRDTVGFDTLCVAVCYEADRLLAAVPGILEILHDSDASAK